MAPIPVILVTGFLGSGKTTFINQILRDHPEKKISLILNEFGDMKLESQFITVKGVGMISELAGGCLCCVANVDLPRVIRYTVEHAPATEYLVIEASGLSDPDPVRATLTSPLLSDLIRLDTVVAIVDADNFARTAPSHPLVMSQIAEADFAVISKVQGKSDEALRTLIARVQNIGTGTRTLVWNDQFATDIIFDPPLTEKSRVTPTHHTHESYEEYWYKATGKYDLARLEAVLRRFPENILRIKGYLDHGDGSRTLVQKVGHHVEFAAAESAVPEGGLVLLFLGQSLDTSDIQQQLAGVSISV